MTATPGPGPAADVDDGAARKLNLLGRIAFWAFLLIVILALLPFGANRPWSWSLLSLLLGAVTLLWVASKVLDRGRIAVPLRRCWPFLALFGLIVLWPLLQSSGFPPASWHHPLWSQAAEALGEPLNGAVSVNPGATREAVMRLLGYGAVFWLALQFGRNTYRARQLLWALACSAAPYALYGLIVKATGNDTILWFDKWAYPNSITSTFVNRNSYATFAGMGFLCTDLTPKTWSRPNVRLGLFERRSGCHVNDIPRNRLSASYGRRRLACRAAKRCPRFAGPWVFRNRRITVGARSTAA